MSLKVKDLKLGDVVRVDRIVTDIEDNEVRIGGQWMDDDDLAGGNAEKVVRARPVRKGDAIVHRSSGTYFYLTSWAGDRYATKSGRGATTLVGDEWTHADGSPIDWEASE